MLPEWIEDLPPGPVVHATLGTVADRPDLLQTIIEALADEPLTLIVATGPRRDPKTLGALPPDVRVATYISHDTLLPRCDAIITYAGAGTLIASIKVGLPLLLIPMFGDQPANAHRAKAAGVAVVLEQSTITPAAVRAGTYALLNESRRQQFSALQQEIASLPPVERAVGWFEQIAHDRAPLFRAAGPPGVVEDVGARQADESSPSHAEVQEDPRPPIRRGGTSAPRRGSTPVGQTEGPGTGWKESTNHAYCNCRPHQQHFVSPAGGG